VREAEGAWLLNRKPAGIYIRVATTGTRATDWTYAGEFPDVFNDANLVIYNDTDSTKNVKFDVSAVTTGTTRTISAPDKNITLDDAGDSRSPSAHASSHEGDAADPVVITRYTQIQDAVLDNPSGFKADILYSYSELLDVPATFTPSSHTHGNLTNDGKIGTTSGLPLKTGTDGVLEAGSFGTSAGTFAAGDDSRFGDIPDPSSATPQALGTAAAGSSDDYSRADHVHGAPALNDLSNVSAATPSDNDVLVYDNATSTWVAEAPAAGGIAGSTGSTDNAILRADGTGGSTAQAADIVIDDATTSTQANVAITNQHDGQTNSALVLTPKGFGAFIVGPKPDGTVTGGIARGTQAVDLQLSRSSNSQCAIGAWSFQAGYRNTASGAVAVCLGAQNTSSGFSSICIGGTNSTASQAYSATIGNAAVADREVMLALASGRFASSGDAQRVMCVLRNKTTNDSATELFYGGSSTRFNIPSGKVMAMLVNITGVKSDGSAVAHYVRQYAIKNVGGTTSEVYGAVTIGTDSAASTSIALSANDTNDALKIEVTGIASETWRWVASVDAVEVAYGS